MDEDDPSNKDISFPELLKAQLSLLPYTTKMEPYTQLQQKPATRSCSLGARSRSPALPVPGQAAVRKQDQERRTTRQRRVTIASYMPQSTDQNGNFAEKDNNRQVAKSLGALNTEEVCQWFSSIGLQKCLPFIREGQLCGADIASVDMMMLEALHIASPEERELLLSSVYKELHPPSSTAERLDSLIDTFGPHSIERFTAALMSMGKSKSSPHVSCLNMMCSSLKLRNKSSVLQRNTPMIEITVNALEQIVHLRTPKGTTVGKVKESCIKMLGMTEDKDIFTLKDNRGFTAELSPNQQIGSLLTSANRQLELNLCKKDKQLEDVVSKENCSQDRGNVSENVQPTTQPAKEDQIKELHQQVDSLQHVVHQVLELHQGLLAFCSELRNTEGEVDMKGLGPAELEQRLELARSHLRDQRQSLQNLKENISNAVAQRNTRSEIRLMDKMKINCQVFKEEICLVHLTRQVAHLQNALQDCCDKERSNVKHSAVGPLSRLVSPQCPAILLVVQERPGADGRYGFTCCCREIGGLVVVEVDDSQLCLEDRLVEVNAVAVVNSTEEELNSLLLQGSSAQIVVLRRPPLSPTSDQHPGVPRHLGNIVSSPPERDAVATETPTQRELITI